MNVGTVGSARSLLIFCDLPKLKIGLARWASLPSDRSPRSREQRSPEKIARTGENFETFGGEETFLNILEL